MLTIATANVNGIRAAFRRGMGTWLAAARPDILAMQEVRAPDAILDALMAEHLGPGWHIAQQACDIKGRAGVAIASRLPVRAVRVGLGRGEPEPPVDTGRWVEIDVELPGNEVLTAVSAYIHSGVAETPKMAEKYAYLDKVTERLRELATPGRLAVVAGDLNIAHQNVDIANWRGNLKNAGFLPAERAYLDAWLGSGWVDVGRALGGVGPGPYTWWTWRGGAFDRDTGWRIDYQVATPALAERAVKAEVHRAASNAERFSDHAPLVVEYEG